MEAADLSFQDLLKAKPVEDDVAVAPACSATARDTSMPVAGCSATPALKTQPQSSDEVDSTSVDDMHKKVRDAMLSRNKANEPPMMKRPAAATVPSGKHPPLPCLEGTTNPEPFLY